MHRTACTEPQCLYSTAIPLLPLCTVRPVQSLSACTRVHFTFTFTLTLKLIYDHWCAEQTAFENLKVRILRRNRHGRIEH